MKKLLAMVLITASLTANAFWNNNNWGGWNNGYGQDNGMFGFNPYDYWDPRWYAEEMSNMVDEFDNNNNWGNNYYGYRSNRYGNYNPYQQYRNGTWNNTFPAQSTKTK